MSANNMGDRIINLFFPWMKKFVYKKQWPHLHIHYSSEIECEGVFSYGRNVAFDESSRIKIEKNGKILIGSDCYFGKDFETSAGSGHTIKIGNRVSFQNNTTVFGDVEIGSYVLMAPRVFISSGQHNFLLDPPQLIKVQDQQARQDLSRVNSKPIKIGEDCWIGANVVIMKGVQIGRGAVIGANSVVTKNIPSYTIAAGVPAKVIGERLKFNPPLAISCKQVNDIPYFYEGFTYGSDGCTAGEKFVLCLDSSDTTNSKIVLSCKKIVPYQMSLQFEDQLIALNDNIELVHINVKTNGPFFEFKLIGAPPFCKEDLIFLTTAYIK